MNNGWIKLHRKILNSLLWEDTTACHIFIWLLLMADHKNGRMRLGRKWASKAVGLKETTFYNGLLRLEKTHKCIIIMTRKLTIKFTEIEIINWKIYQSNDNPIDNPMTMNRQSNDNPMTHNKNKELRIKNKELPKGNSSYGNEDINEVSSYFLQTMSLPKEDCTQKQSRQYWNLLLKESKTGREGVKWLIDLAHDDDILARNITSSKDLYYKRIKLISRKRGSKPRIAVFGGGEIK